MAEAKGHHPNNMTAWYSNLMDYLKGMNRDDPQYSETMDKLYQSLYDDMHDNMSGYEGDIWSEGFILGEEVPAHRAQYMHLRPYIYGAILVVITLLGIACNIAVGYLVIKRNVNCPTAMRVLVINMMLACLVFLVGGIPLLLVENVFGYGWQLGHVACKVHRYIIYVSFYIISYSLVLILFFLFLSVWIPHHIIRYVGAKMAATICSSLWILILLANIPNYLGHGITEEIAGISYCFNQDMHDDIQKVRAWTILQFLFTFAIPLALLTSLTVAMLFQMCRAPPGDYSQLIDESHSNRQMATLAICLTVTFAICWTPDKIFSLLLVLRPRRMGIPLLIASDVMMCLAYINPALNPLVVLLTSPHLARVTSGKPIRNGSTQGAEPEAEEGQRQGDAEEPMMISSV